MVNKNLNVEIDENVIKEIKKKAIDESKDLKQIVQDILLDALKEKEVKQDENKN